MAKKTKKQVKVATVAKPNEAKTIKVLYGYLVDHTKKEPAERDNRVFLTTDDAVKGDIFCVWAGEKLRYFKVQKVQQKYEYVKADNSGVSLSDIRYVIQKLDVRNYNILKAFGAKTKGLLAALAERVEEARSKSDVADLIKSLKGEQKAEVEALTAALEALKADPASALGMD